MINWSDFQKLPGSAENNFEFLCRALIRLHYGKCGQFAALANQPGVEFHLHLDDACDLGAAGRWLGWQCRWYDLPSGRALGNTRRKKVEDAVVKSTKALPGLTDWVLWTRNPLTKGDQTWFYGLKKKLKSKLKFDLWNSTDAERLLSGDAEILRKTYFGELLLTPAILAELHNKSVAPIRTRWLPEAHQSVDAERTIRRMLGEAASWDELTNVAKRLLSAVACIQKEPLALAGKLSSLTPPFIKAACELAGNLQDVHKLLGSGDLELLRVKLDSRPLEISKEIAAAPRKMRGARIECGLIATNALADLKYGMELLEEVAGFLGVRMIAVVADAGGGKTQMAAELTAEIPGKRPAGIFMRGSELHSGRTLDDLPKCNSITIQGIPIPSLEALLAALDAAGQRARRRLPLVIDGLNEAQCPTDWKDPLSSLATMLDRFANVLVVCTIRTGARRSEERHMGFDQPEEPPARMDFAHQALPEAVRQIEASGFGGDTMEAIQRYFRHFKINPEDADLPVELLSHPLTLRIFCEVTNRDRKREVSIEAIPGSLAGLFEKYLDYATERIERLSHRDHKYRQGDIRRVINVIGTAFWENRARELQARPIMRVIGDETLPWDKQLLPLLEQEGIILFVPSDDPNEKNIIPVYDALGGFLVANAVVTMRSPDELKTWLHEPSVQAAFAGHSGDVHPLALDIFRSLVGLVPSRFPGNQIWHMLEGPLKTPALRMAAALEGRSLDAATVAALSDHLRSGSKGAEGLFLRLFHMRGGPDHPLNASFLDSTLRLMSVGERDLLWTEWGRRNVVVGYSYDRQLDILGDVQSLEQRWKASLSTRSASDRLRAKWLMWLLPTTVHNLRDRVTRAIYWFGRSDPTSLFEITAQAADINDPYVFERMLAASYGVAMACHCDPKTPEFRKTKLPEFARKIFDLLFRVDAPSRTTHVLTREYGRRVIELAAHHNRKLFSETEVARTRPPFSDGGRIAWKDVEEDESETRGADSPFRMDFENYTLGRLVEGRGNYNFEHAGYRKVRAQVLWRVRQLGWTPEKFQPTDRAIESDRHGYGRVVDEHHKVDRYGKKYSWIGYFELGGWLQDQGLLKERDDYGRTWDVDIDPSFPSPTPEARLIAADFLGDPKQSLADWIKKGPPPDLEPFIRQTSIREETGPWVALDGFVTQQDESRGRRLFAFVRSFFVAKSEANTFAAALAKQPLSGRWLPEKPGILYTFAGEMPWCSAFPNTRPVEMRFVVKEHKLMVKRKRQVLTLDGEPLSLTQMDLLQIKMFGWPPSGVASQEALTEDDLKRIVSEEVIEDVEEVRQDFRKFRAWIPVLDFDWEKRNVDNVPVHGITLGKRFAQSSGLVHLPQTHDLQTKDGVRATHGITVHPQDFNNSERFFFIRENILRALLKKLNMSVVWAIWGERELSNKQMERARPDGDLAGLSHGDFQTVILFK
jgi:hypothetical protein